MAAEKKIGGIMPYHPENVLKRLERMKEGVGKIKKEQGTLLEKYNIDINVCVKNGKCIGSIGTEIPLIHARVSESQLFEPLIGSHLEPERRSASGDVIPYDIEGSILARKVAKKYGVNFIEEGPEYELKFSMIKQVRPGIKKIAQAKDTFSNFYEKLGSCREKYIDALMKE